MPDPASPTDPARPPDRPTAPDRATAPVLDVRGLTKSYGEATVLDGVDLVVRPGEVHALLGENGAGKSTLIKIVSGVVVPDRGTVTIAGTELHFGSPRGALEAGVSTLFQELATVGGLSVSENVFLGRPTPSRFGVVRWRALDDAARELFATLGVELDVTVDADTLTPVQETMTALARALSEETPLLILDEPTAALTDAETSQLFDAIRRLTDHGVGVLYVSHRLEEVFTVADRYSVLRNGRKVAEGGMADTDVDAVIAAMAGRSIDAIFPERSTAKPGDVVLAASGLTGRRVVDVSLELRAGEVVGIAGLAGSGRSELLRLLAGASRVHAGSITLDNAPYRPGDIHAAQDAGVVLVPPERRSQAILPDTVERNLNLATIDRHARGVVVSPASERADAERMWADLDVRGRDVGQDALTLSGGNQQKVVLARFLALEPRVLLLDEPTRGVDVSTKSQIYGLIRDQAAVGRAVLVVSSELIELLGVCDRILVLHEGRLAGSFAWDAMTEEELLHACYGRAA